MAEVTPRRSSGFEKADQTMMMTAMLAERHHANLAPPARTPPLPPTARGNPTAVP